MKKLLILFLIVLCSVSAVSCSKSKTETKSSSKKAEAVFETKAPEKTAVYGIDVSSFNGIIDWKKVKDDNISFAMIRAGGRGFGEEGGLYEDKYALRNLKNAQKQNIGTGVYFFSQAVSTAEAEEEAEFVSKLLKGQKLKLPVAYDVERIKGDTSRIDSVKYNDNVRYAKAFLKKITSLGYTSMVYIGEYSILKAEDFKDYKIWLADYGKPYDSGYEMLQYSKTGKVKGINTDVDLDIMYPLEK